MNDSVNQQSLPNLSPGARRLAAVLARPRTIAIICVAVLTSLGWAAYAFTLLRSEGIMSEATCGLSLAGNWDALNAAIVTGMWQAMTLAMMVPSAAPMILTYAEIAETATQKQQDVVSPLVLAGGYLAIWDAFSFGAASMQTTVSVAGLGNIGNTPIAGVVFILAGLYQFSRLKLSCLSYCQRPFPYFFANWTTKVWGVFVLGLRQGAYCIGCCWALMLIMFAVGSMNIIWMAGLGAVMTIEKMSTSMRFSRAVGAALIAVGGVLVALELK